ncbi:hypothetical protein BZK18_04825 [Helicobacter pylori]|uniref:hypothetical protein n=1 Tax=Helicobacter pylori TaxID=210 RepID=UPI0009895EDA|nr:hypothetical protein [Helicobacter pylori]OOC21722.1 hypothetical protein BZK18_04825 [Helicobacter pylori]
MWNERCLKVIPAMVFLFCILSILELFLIIGDMNKTEKLESEVKNNLEVTETIINLLNEHLEYKELEKEPKIKIFKNKIR